jgi:hypothetical protein
LRVPHFFGLHGAQVLPVFGWLVLRRNPRAGRRRYAAIAGISYLSLTGILTWQAMRGQAIIAPDGAMLAAVILWLLGTALALAAARPGVWPARRAAAGGVAA